MKSGADQISNHSIEESICSDLKSKELCLFTNFEIKDLTNRTRPFVARIGGECGKIMISFKGIEDLLDSREI